jgi:hypothetical protein
LEQTTFKSGLYARVDVFLRDLRTSEIEIAITKTSAILCGKFAEVADIMPCTSDRSLAE